MFCLSNGGTCMTPQRADMLTSTYLLFVRGSQSEGFLKVGGDGRSSLLSVSALSCNDPNTVTPLSYSFTTEPCCRYTQD